jgi:prepilin-type N-terminal cleavage/methylation domain-containing protein
MANIHRIRSAFTLIEIVVVSAIIGLLAALVFPQFVKSRKLTQSRRVLNDVRQMDAAIGQWAMEKGKAEGDAIVTTEAASYLKAAWPDNDVLGNAYSITVVGSTQVQINVSTKAALDGVGIDWGPY